MAAKKFGTIAICLLALSTLSALSIGDKAPSFALNSLDGKRITLEDLLKDNKPLLISFFATWCEPCDEETPALKKIFVSKKASVVLISLDTDASIEEIKDWLKKRDIKDLPVLLDPKGIAGERYGVISSGGRADIPHVFLISPQKKTLWYHKGLDKDLETHVTSAIEAWQGSVTTVPDENTAPLGSLWIFFTNSANGWVTSCNCPQQPMGGLGRRLSYIEQARRKFRPALIFDTGDNLPSLADEKKAHRVIQAFKLIAYDAMVPGDQEFSLGAKFAMDNILLAERPYLTANLGVCPEGSTCIIPYGGSKIFEANGLKIGVIGVFHGDTLALASKKLKKEVKVFPLEKKITALLKTIRPQVDVVILLSHSGLSNDQALAEKIQGIDLIIGGHSQDLIKTPIVVGKTSIVQAGPGGQYVGKMLVAKENDKVLIKSYELVPLGEEIPDHPSITQLLETNKILVP